MKTRKAIAATGVALALLGAAAPMAGATTYQWPTGDDAWFANNTPKAGPSTDYFTMVMAVPVVSGRIVYVGAHVPGGRTMYGSMVGGNGSACHQYASNTLGSMVANGESYGQTLKAYYFTHGTGGSC